MHFKIQNTHFVFHSDTELLINDKKIETSAKTILAIRLFLESDNEIISKEKLMHSLWGNLIVSEDSIFKVIQECRKIFNQHVESENTLINVYGKGYRIQPTIHNQNDIPKGKLTHTYIFTGISILIIALISYFLLKYEPSKILFDKNKYNYTIKLINISPTEAIEELDTYDIEKLNKPDMALLFYLKGFAYYTQGKYMMSRKNLNQGCNLRMDLSNNNAVADSCTLLSLINVYRSKPEEMITNLNFAKEIYNITGNTEGLNNTKYYLGLYLIMVHKYSQAIEQANQFLMEARKSNDKFNQIRAHLNLMDAYAETGDKTSRSTHLNKAMNLSLEIGNGKYIAYTYGTQAVDSMKEGHFQSAMDWANKTLKYAIHQNNTNDFQQGFSYMYNILSPLGHDELAEKYLQAAIDIQAKFNSDGHIHFAELSLGILKLKLNKHRDAKGIFNQLLTYNLSDSDRQETNAWRALNFYFLKDTISAYTIAKEIYSSNINNPRILFIAGTALSLAALELDRHQESVEVLDNISRYQNPNWLIEDQYFFHAAITLYQTTGLPKYRHYLEEQQRFNQKLKEIKAATTPDTKILEGLDKYINTILN